MKKIVAILLALCAFGISVFAQSPAGGRARVVATPAPTPPVLQGDPSTQSNTNRPPVLVDRNSPVQIQTPNKAEKEEPGPDDVVKVETNLVTMPVSVLDRDGRFIPGLRPQDFQIFENGVRQKVAYFQPVEQPFTVILMIDISPSTHYRMADIRYAALRFIDQLRPNDRVEIVTFDENIRVLNEPTSDHRLLSSVVMEAVLTGQGTSVYDAVGYVASQEIPKIEGRKAIVLFTDGVDTSSKKSDYQSTYRDVEELDALFYSVRYDTLDDMNYKSYNPAGLAGIIVNGKMIPVGQTSFTSGTSAAEYDTGRRYLDDLARISGGRRFDAENDLGAAFSGVAEELRRQYSIGYYPEAEGKEGERRRIHVEMTSPNLVVRTKTNYVFGANTENLRK